MKNVKGILNVKEFANYIKEYGKNKFNLEVSPLKLQKSLYFCFAYWGGFMRNTNNIDTSNKEININYGEYLFDNKIEAWVYGPVVPDVYHEEKIEKYKNEKLFDGKNYLKEYIDNVLDDILTVNDFRLVEISHEDKCWKNHFNAKKPYHNVEIPKEDIIKEYAKNMQNC